jgi:hypothetical protein
MAGIQPEGESMRRAIRFVSEAIQDDAGRSIASILDEAALRFDLDPRQAEYLIEFYRSARISR